MPCAVLASKRTLILRSMTYVIGTLWRPGRAAKAGHLAEHLIERHRRIGHADHARDDHARSRPTQVLLLAGVCVLADRSWSLRPSPHNGRSATLPPRTDDGDHVEQHHHAETSTIRAIAMDRRRRRFFFFVLVVLSGMPSSYQPPLHRGTGYRPSPCSMRIANSSEQIKDRKA